LRRLAQRLISSRVRRLRKLRDGKS
jgi:hypothetical protein